VWSVKFGWRSSKSSNRITALTGLYDDGHLHAVRSGVAEAGGGSVEQSQQQRAVGFGT
jgi:hypothetical protein